MKTFEDICPDFSEWPKRWMVIDKDIPYGRDLLQPMQSFVERLIASGLKEKTIRKHIDNLWLLGGEIIRSVSLYNEYAIPPVKKLKRKLALMAVRIAGIWRQNLRKGRLTQLVVSCTNS